MSGQERVRRSYRMSKHERAVSDAVETATPEQLRQVLSGTVGDAVTYCRAALRQYDRRGDLFQGDDPGQRFAEMHILLIVAHEAVSHVERVEQLLAALDESHVLPPNPITRDRLRIARHLLAEHRDERVLYWRLTGQHTERVKTAYRTLGVELPSSSIDLERYDDESELASRWGTVGELLSLPGLRDEMRDLEARLNELQERRRAAALPPQPGPTVSITFQIVGPITEFTS